MVLGFRSTLHRMSVTPFKVVHHYVITGLLLYCISRHTGVANTQASLSVRFPAEVLT
jgi:hypothetical protein